MESILAQLHADTDGSKERSLRRISAAACIPDLRVVRSVQLTNHLSVLSTELFAIVLALEWIIEFNTLSAVILSDSLNALKALKSLQDGAIYDLVLEVLHLVTLRIGEVQ